MTRVLIVDDEIDTLNLMRIMMELSGYEAVTTLNSRDAITLAELESPDCALLDIMMPNIDGFMLCRMMRVHPVTATLPIVFVTAYSALDLEDRRLEAGADLVLPKPIGMDALVETVEKAIALRKVINAANARSVGNANSANVSVISTPNSAAPGALPGPAAPASTEKGTL
jgi:pilus assembly protein CpaE